MAIIRTYREIRHLNLYWWQEEMDELEQEMADGTLFGESLRSEDTAALETIKEKLREKVQSFCKRHCFCR
jgi:hypothetical protein